jgi:hypothetical protein
MARGGYTPDEIRAMAPEELAFLYHYQELHERRQHRFIMDTLGVYWEAADLDTPAATSSGGPREKLFLPLSVAINPKILEYVHDQLGRGKTGGKDAHYIGGGEYKPKAGENITSTAGMSKKEFMNLVIGKPSNATPPRKPSS